jgi:hypothetical protein
MGFDFYTGDLFKTLVKRKFRSTVHPLGKANHFLMVVSFGRAKFKLDTDTVGLALESCLGGICDDMLVIQLADRVFRFSVESRHVGFMIYAMKSFACDSFKCFSIYGEMAVHSGSLNFDLGRKSVMRSGY